MQKVLPENGGVQPLVQSGVIVAAPGSVAKQAPKFHVRAPNAVRLAAFHLDDHHFERLARFVVVAV
jgi:hypothetical protein